MEKIDDTAAKALCAVKAGIVALCESPLQLLNIIEYSLRHNRGGTVLIRLNGSKVNEDQFKEVLKNNRY